MDNNDLIDEKLKRKLIIRRDRITQQRMSVPTSMELWASSKIIGRECARVNKDFYMCKKNNGPEPQKCEVQGNSVTNCATKM